MQKVLLLLKIHNKQAVQKLNSQINRYFCIGMQTWIIRMLNHKAIYCIYIFLFLINLPNVSKFKVLFKITFCRDQPLSFFHRFLNANFSIRFNFTSNLLEKRTFIHYSVFPCYISTAKI